MPHHVLRGWLASSRRVAIPDVDAGRPYQRHHGHTTLLIHSLAQRLSQLGEDERTAAVGQLMTSHRQCNARLDDKLTRSVHPAEPRPAGRTANDRLRMSQLPAATGARPGRLRGGHGPATLQRVPQRGRPTPAYVSPAATTGAHPGQGARHLGSAFRPGARAPTFAASESPPAGSGAAGGWGSQPAVGQAIGGWGGQSDVGQAAAGWFPTPTGSHAAPGDGG